MILKQLVASCRNPANLQIIPGLLLGPGIEGRFSISAFANDVIPKELPAGMPGRWDCGSIVRARGQLGLAALSLRGDATLVATAPLWKEQISSMFYFNRCVKRCGSLVVGQFESYPLIVTIKNIQTDHCRLVRRASSRRAGGKARFSGIWLLLAGPYFAARRAVASLYRGPIYWALRLEGSFKMFAGEARRFGDRGITSYRARDTDVSGLHSTSPGKEPQDSVVLSS